MTSTPDPAAEADIVTDAAADAPAEAAASAVEETSAPSTVVDERLLSAHDLAREALKEITPESTIGDPAGYTVEADGVVSLRFYNRLAGYPGWFWTVSVAAVEGSEPTVLEVELLPGEGALLAPEWVPWAERLAEYQAAQAAASEAAGEPGDDDGDGEDLDENDDDDEDELDESDFSEDGSPILHAGDLDGVDIDELDESATASDEDDESDDDEDDKPDDDEDESEDDEPDDEDDEDDEDD